MSYYKVLIYFYIIFCFRDLAQPPSPQPAVDPFQRLFQQPEMIQIQRPLMPVNLYSQINYHPLAPIYRHQTQHFMPPPTPPMHQFYQQQFNVSLPAYPNQQYQWNYFPRPPPY